MNGILDTRKRKWLDVYAGKSKTVFTILPQKELGTIIEQRPNAWFFDKKHTDATMDWVKRYYEAQVNLVDKIDDYRIPYLYVPTGTEIFAQVFGCDVSYAEDNMPCARPLVYDLDDLKNIRRPSIGDEPLATILKMMDELYDWSGKEAIFKLIDVQTPMDIAALIIEKTTFFMAMLDAPDTILDVAENVKEVLFKFFDHWFSRFGDEYIAHFPDYFMKGGITVSEDEVGTVSTDMFEEFFLAELNEMSDHFGGIGIHCCADAHHQWDNFAKVKNLKVLNLHQPHDIIVKAYERFEDVTTQFHSAQNTGDADKWYYEKPANARCIYDVVVKDIEEGKKVADKIKNYVKD